MKKCILILFFLFCFKANAQPKLTFSYDAAGNQISRILCINCVSKTVKEVKEIEAITQDDLLQFSEKDFISYYPNPVREELYLQWQLVNDNYVTSIHLYSMTGQVLRTYQQNIQDNNLTVPFQSYPAGVYIVLMSCKDGGEKSIKIIKQ
ncbi:T9SS type A sorting domain-containing protein [Flavobacterium sp. N1736]|uniref:T9SS type A sorting domain-containing protein n=1 Tax=Flavobacterium sp. N1736 TaxID=2986823 RepID=UPI00222426D1|nr:T9SS type A sorting domain-containing protein [Flavobacterium sp. N1736]